MPEDPLYWRLRGVMGDRTRAAARRAVDRIAGEVVGSVRGATGTRRVALTLDDGPDPSVTPAILDLLNDRALHATFFVLVENARAHSDVVRRMIRGGHEVGLHGADHRPVRGMSYRRAVDYLRQARQELEEITQSGVRLYRPPFGAQSVASYAAARTTGLEVVVWTTDVADWEQRSRESVVRDALGTPDGGILLFHDRLVGWKGREAADIELDRPAAVRDIVDAWLAQGRRPCSIGELRAEGRLQRSVWFRP